MSTLKKVNHYRRKLTRLLTKNVGKTNYTNNSKLEGKLKINRVLVSRPNHRLGNLLLITPLLQEVSETFPDCKIDVFVKGNLAPILFENYANVDKIISLPRKPFKNLWTYIMCFISIRNGKYDLTINVTENSSSGRLAAKYSKAKHKIFGDLPQSIITDFKDHEHIAKYPVYGLRYYLSYFGHTENKKAAPVLNLKLKTSEIEQGKSVLDAIVPNTKKTICIFTFATGNKCYSESFWDNLYTTLLNHYPNYNILEVLPVENVSQINFKAPSYYSKDIREIGAVFANTEVFIGADSGMMHLASASLTPTVGLFSVTNTKVYEPYGHGSIAINTTTDTTEDCINAIDKILGITR